MDGRGIVSHYPNINFLGSGLIVNTNTGRVGNLPLINASILRIVSSCWCLHKNASVVWDSSLSFSARKLVALRYSERTRFATPYGYDPNNYQKFLGYHHSSIVVRGMSVGSIVVTGLLLLLLLLLLFPAVVVSTVPTWNSSFRIHPIQSRFRRQLQ